MQYHYIWNNQDICDEVISIDEWIDRYETLTNMFKEWRDNNIIIQDNDNGIATFITNNKEYAEENGFDKSK